MGRKSDKRARQQNVQPRVAKAGLHTPVGADFVLAVTILVAMIVVIFAPLVHYGFVSLDDKNYVAGRIRDGITAGNIKWVFSEVYFGFYIPVTYLSHMLDCQLYGDWAGGHHLTNLLIHLANTLLLIAFLWRATKAPWRSFFVAALFAVHPLHVESVAWISERKDVLSTFFEFLAFLAYVRYAERPSLPRYVPVFTCFSLALLAKPMVVTFPFMLLLLDYWPLRRLDQEAAPAGGYRNSKKKAGGLLAEKAPLFALIPVVGWLTVLGQAGIEAISGDERLPFDQRLANALLSYTRYLAKMVFPSKLSAYYPHIEGRYSVPLVVLSFVFLAAATVAVFRLGRRFRYVPVGWFWYLGGLVPVIGLVQAGLQSSADRYTYVPLVGLFMIVSWGLGDALGNPQPRKIRWLALPVSVLLLVLAFAARAQVETWRSNEVLYRRILAYYPVNPLALINLGSDLGSQKRCEEAVRCFESAARVTPTIPPDFELNWAFCLCELGRYDEAEALSRKVLSKNPKTGRGHFILGYALSQLQRPAEAIPHYREALSLKGVPASDLVWVGDVYRKGGLCDEAVAVYRIVPADDPAYPKATEGIAACKNKP